MNLTIHFSLLHWTRFEPEQRQVIRLMREATVPCYTLCIRALHKVASSGSRKDAESTCRGCIVRAPPLLAELCRLQVAGWVFIACHYCSATVMLGAAPLIRTPLLPSAHRNCPLVGLPKELLRTQLLLSRFAAPEGFSPPLTHRLLSLPLLSPGPGLDGRAAGAGG